MHSADYAVARCLSVYLPVCSSVCLSHAGILWTPLNISSIFSPSGSSTILVFPHKTLRQYSDGNPSHEGRQMQGGMKKSRFSTNILLYLQNDVRAIVAMEDEYETVVKLSNGAISNDLESPLTYISRSRYYSTLNNSKMVQDRAILSQPTESRMIYYNGAIFSDLEQSLTQFPRSCDVWWYHKVT